MEKNSILSNFLWKLAERMSSQGVSFVVSVVLARLLLPSEFGIVAMIQVFIIIANVFVVSGFSSALIQKKDADDYDFSTILYCSLLLSIILYIIIFCLSPSIASFFNEPILKFVTRVYGISLIISAYNSVQQAWVSRHMKFKLFFYSTLSGNIVSGIIGVIMAYMGYGVWALVFQVLISQIINTVVLAKIIDWHPILFFSKKRAIPLVRYGWKILGSDLISSVYFHLRQLLIGKYYTASDLAYYNRGAHIPEIVSSNIDRSLVQVLFPAMSNYSDNSEKIKELTRKSMKTTSYVMFYIMTLLIILAEPLVRIIYTEKWIACVPFFQLMGLAKMLQTVSHANLQSFKAVGRSDLVLKLEFIKKPIGFLLIFISFPISVYAVALTVPVYGLYSASVNAFSNRNVLGYTMKQQLKDLKPAILLSLIIYLFSYIYIGSDLSDWIKLLLGFSLSSIIYFGLSFYFKLESFQYCYKTCLRLINLHKK